MFLRVASLLAALAFTACGSSVGPNYSDAASDARTTGDASTTDSNTTPSDASPGACTLPNDGRCPEGTTCPAGDGCNDCTCASGLVLMCTQRPCHERQDAGPTEPVFACGLVLTCRVASQYCQHTATGDGADQYSCADLPAACTADGGAATCACFEGVTCGGSCATDTTGGITVTCVGA